MQKIGIQFSDFVLIHLIQPRMRLLLRVDDVLLEEILEYAVLSKNMLQGRGNGLVVEAISKNPSENAA